MWARRAGPSGLRHFPWLSPAPPPPRAPPLFALFNVKCTRPAPQDQQLQQRAQVDFKSAEFSQGAVW